MHKDLNKLLWQVHLRMPSPKKETKLVNKEWEQIGSMVVDKYLVCGVTEKQSCHNLRGILSKEADSKGNEKRSITINYFFFIEEKLKFTTLVLCSTSLS